VVVDEFFSCCTSEDDILVTTTPQYHQQQQTITPTPSGEHDNYPVQQPTRTIASHSSIEQHQPMNEEQTHTPLTETLPGMDTPIIPRTVDLNTISQQETDSFVSDAAHYFVEYFVEGISPTSDVMTVFIYLKSPAELMAVSILR
jgi:hypothetical protein